MQAKGLGAVDDSYKMVRGVNKGRRKNQGNFGNVQVYGENKGLSIF